MNHKHPSAEDSPWPHRLAVLMVCATFPLIWVGGLVTTYDAGMAVPDWPTTYGYNLFAYPWRTWLFGPWDLFIEHGHRLLGAAVGLLTILFAVAVWRCDRRPWMHLAGVAAVVLVLLQGVLGGARVLMDEQTLAMIHGCIGPAFFGYCVALSCMTSRWWQQTSAAAQEHRATPALCRVAFVTLILVYLQLVIGAQVRHISVMASPGAFRVAVLFHLLVAGVVIIYVVQLLDQILRRRAAAEIRRPGLLLGGLLLVQLVLGLATWVVKYGWPEFVAQYRFAAGHVVYAQSMGQSLVVTSHVAVGSLLLGLAVLLLTRSLRLARVPSAALGPGALLMEWAT